MSAKTIKRILYGVFAAAFLFLGGRELLAAGLTLKAVTGMGAGLLVAFIAVTGKG